MSAPTSDGPGRSAGAPARAKRGNALLITTSPSSGSGSVASEPRAAICGLSKTEAIDSSGPTAQPARVNTAMTSSRGRVAQNASMSASSASPFATRSALVRKRGSATSASPPIVRSTRSATSCVLPESATYAPSPQRYAPRGAVSSSRLPSRRCSVPFAAYSVSCDSTSFITAS